MSGKLVVLSNRLPAPASDESGRPVIAAGGLASAIFSALKARSGSLWFGWNGKVESRERIGRLTHLPGRNPELVGMSLLASEIEDFYHGFCNMVLWPLFHSFQARVRIEAREEAAYRRVQTRFADTLLRLIKPKDRLWVHDYHFLLVARELRRRGWSGKAGFYLHVPFPAYDLWQVLPDHRGFLEALFEYDVIGFQVRGYLDNYTYACQRILGARWDGRTLTVGRRRQRAGIYPVGIDPKEFAPVRDPRWGRTPRRGVLAKVVRGRRLILGVDRLDYTKGIPGRIRAYEQFIRRFPAWRKKVSYIQIAAPSRTAAAHYQEEKRAVEALVGRVNGEMAEHDWVPIRYLYRTYPRSTLARFYQEADVGLVTPLRDGMNLVAKEFVASQHPDLPGVLVLSRCAGASEELPEALVVNPFDVEDVAAGLSRALAMPLDERRERHRALLERVRRNTAARWSDRFVRDLEGAGDDTAPLAPPARAGAPPLGIHG